MKYLLFVIVAAAAVILIACSQGGGPDDSAGEFGNTSASAEPSANRPTPTPEPVCDPGYVPVGSNSCCPADSPTLAWGDSCVSESHASWAIDSVTYWFFGLAGLTATDVNLAANRDTCTAKPHSTERYWLVRCADTGGEYLVNHDNADVQSANEAAQTAVDFMETLRSLPVDYSGYENDYSIDDYGTDSPSIPISANRCSQALYEWAQSGYLSPSAELDIELYCGDTPETYTEGSSYPISRDKCAEALLEWADSNFLSPSAEIDIDLYC